MPKTSPMAGNSPHGWASCRASTPAGASPRCWASASAETPTWASCSTYGARAVIRAAQSKADQASGWFARVLARRNKNVAAVALANKNARIVWDLCWPRTATAHRPTQPDAGGWHEHRSSPATWNDPRQPGFTREACRLHRHSIK
jgi:hypothetical protein